MKRIFALFLSAAAFAAAVNAQDLGYLMAGPSAEYRARRAYAPVDFVLGQLGPGGYGGLGYGYPYYYGNGRFGTDIAVAAVAGLAGGLVANAVSHRRRDDREYVPSPDGRGRAYYAYNEPQRREVVFVAPKPQKPLDCRKPRGKRGKNEAACATAEQELAAAEATARQEAERRALANSPWRLYNRSGFVIEVFDGEKELGRMRVNQSWRVLDPNSGYRAMILDPDPDSGAIVRHEARIRRASDFQGWVITSPKVEEE